MTRHNIRLGDLARDFPCREDQHLLAALGPVHQRRIQSGCHGGGCGVCKILVRSGDYTTGGMSRAHISPEEEAQGITLACRTYPRSDMEVEPWGKLPVAMVRRYSLLPQPSLSQPNTPQKKA